MSKKFHKHSGPVVRTRMWSVTINGVYVGSVEASSRGEALWQAKQIYGQKAAVN